ncbi:MAG: hypothetical protein RMN24_04220 [Anaerolineae bacterium]|nr:hypothetical protein [Caldilineales bacterium]MDW8268353.1 hypothetical protein [Anaerolineae bacterium]
MTRTAVVRLLPLLVLAWLVALLTAPPERTLGGVVRWVYAHAALTQAALLLFLVTAVVAGLFLAGYRRLYPWVSVMGGAALVLWLLGFLLSLPPARLTWGVWVDWAEPRTQLTLRVLGVGLVVTALTHWVRSPRLTAVTQLLFSLTVLFLNRQAALVRHPLNPIGQAAGTGIPLSYGLIVLLTVLLVGFGLALWSLRHREARPNGRS